MKSVVSDKIGKSRATYIYIGFFLIMIFLLCNKRNMHVDEWLSYTLSNGVENVQVEFDEGYTYSSVEQVYLDSIAVNRPEGRFQFKNVWKNQENDVHPPLYYLILHIICSCNVGRFSMWYAAGINIFFALMTLCVWRKLMRLFVNDEEFIDFWSVVFILSEGVLQNVSFLRMYVMAMFWVTLTAYLFVRGFEEKFSWKRWIQIVLAAVAGALTHYYCIIYLCATCLVFGICLVIQGKWKDILALVCYMAASAAVSICIFPAMLAHMFSGYRGTESIDNLTKATWKEHWERLKAFYGFINKQMLGKIGGACILFVLFLIVMFVWLKRNEGSVQFHFRKRQGMKLMIIAIPVIVYFIFVSESAAYVTDRYLFPIYAVTFGMFAYLMSVLLRGVLSEKNVSIVMCMIGTVVIINGLGTAPWVYLYRESADLLDKAKMYEDQNCICVYDEKWKTYPSFYELSSYKSVTFIQQENTDSIARYDDLFEDSFILTVVGGG